MGEAIEAQHWLHDEYEQRTLVLRRLLAFGNSGALTLAVWLFAVYSRKPQGPSIAPMLAVEVP